MNKMTISQTEKEIEKLKRSLEYKKYYNEHRLEIIAKKRAKRLEEKLKKENPEGLSLDQKRQIRNAKQRAYRENPEVKEKHLAWNKAYNERPEVMIRKIERAEENKFKGLARQMSFFSLKVKI